jgi:hypothetical protein
MHHRSSSTSCFKRYVATIIGSLLLIAASGVLFFELAIRWDVANINWYMRRSGWVNSVAEADVIYGDSHAAFGISGLGSFANLAIPGITAPELRRFIAQRLHHTRGRRVILVLGPRFFSLAETRPVSADFTDFIEAGHPPRGLLSRFPYLRRQAYAIAKARLLGTATGGAPPLEQADGSIITEERLAQLPAHRRDATLASKLRVQEPSGNPAAAPAAHDFAEALHELRLTASSVCVVVLPVAQDLARARALRPSYAKAVRVLSGLAEAAQVPFVDLSSRELDDFMFSDIDHLSSDGSMTLRPIIQQQCGI